MHQKIEDYDFPKDLKKMNRAELELLSYQIRDFLLEKVSVTGGHLASNLGVVELTIALHRVFNSPKDRIIWDVGHQAYVHKILTGRASGFDHLRQTGGMSGFPKASESEHDAFDTGHSSTSISAAAGYAAARDIDCGTEEVVAVIGDGALTGGMVYEAMNNVGASGSHVIIVLNDNGMSISKNIGGVSKHLNKLRTSSRYRSLKKNTKKVISGIPVVGKNLSHTISDTKEWMKYALISGGIMFEELGFTYLGPVDGNDIGEDIQVLRQAASVPGPVLVHVVTKKGKGYRNAEQNPDKFHGIGPFDIDTGRPLSAGGTGWSGVFGKTVLSLAERDSGICAITAAMGSATGFGEFSRRFPKRFFDVGIAEAHAVTFSAGLAKAGKKPFAAIYSTFLQRAYDQILEDVCLQDLPVVFGIDRAGIVGADGETHHGVFDLAYLLPMPNMRIFAPADGNDLEAMVEAAASCSHPTAIRYPRGNCRIDPEEHRVYSGGNVRIRSGKDGDLWAVGAMLDTGREVCRILEEQGIFLGLVSVKSVKPLDLSLLPRNTKRIYTLEDGVLTGGYGQYMKAHTPAFWQVTGFGWPDRFIEQGAPADLYQKYGLDAAGVAERIREDNRKED